MSSEPLNEGETNYPTIEIENLGDGRWRASAVIDTPIDRSHLRDAGSISSIAEGEFSDFEEELRAQLNDGDRVQDRHIRVSSVSFRGDQDEDVVVQSTLIIEFTKCDATDTRCDDIVGMIIKDAISELRKELARDLAQYLES
jgi:hypothetical protein